MSDQERKKPGPKPKKALPHVSILERRLRNPFGEASVAVRLKEGEWATRWFNVSVRTGRIHQGQQLGWTFVTPAELIGRPEDYGFEALDDRLVRGDQANRDYLMKMPKADFEQIQMAKAEKNIREMGSSKKLKEQAAQAASKVFDTDEAGDRIFESNIELTDTRITTPVDESPVTE